MFFGHFVEAHTLSFVAVLVGPFAPLVVIDWEGCHGPLIFGKSSEECLSCIDYRLGGDAGFLEGEEPFFDGPIGSDTFEAFL